MDEWVRTINAVNAYITRINADPQGFKSVAIGVGAAIALGIALYFAEQGIKKLSGMRQMRKRARLSAEVCEIIEDRFVDGLSEAINSGRLTIEEARKLYARLAHLGFWGLHPRKFQPKKTPAELEALKEDLRARHEARKNSKSNGISTSKAMSKLLDGLDVEFAA